MSPGFIFGGNTGLSYEQMKRRRALAEAMMPSGVARNVGEGIGSIGQSIAAALMARSADKAEATGRKQAGSAFDALMARYGGGQAIAPEPAAAPEAPMPQADLVQAVMRQESGGNPNAVSPKGAMGLMQLMPGTARDPGFGVRGTDDPMDPQENMRVGSEYLNAMLHRYGGDTQKALVAYNWGPGNADGWNGDPAALPAETQQYVTNIMATQPRQAPQPQVAQNGGLDPVLLQALANQYLDPGQRAVVEALLQQQIQHNAPPDPVEMAKLQMERQRLGLDQGRFGLEQQRFGHEQQTDAARLGLDQQEFGLEQQKADAAQANDAAHLGLDRERLGLEREKASSTDDLREYSAYADAEKAAGRQPLGFLEYQTALKQAGAETSIGSIPQGYRLARGPEGMELTPIPGGPADTTAQQAAAQASKQQTAAIQFEDIGRAKDLVRSNPTMTTGVLGPILKGWGGSDAADLDALLGTLRANLSIDKLQEMRRNSPTGGALGNVTERENQMLADAMGSLQQSQSADQLVYNLDRLEGIVGKIVNGPQWEPAPPSPAPTQKQPFGGWTVEEIPSG